MLKLRNVSKFYYNNGVVASGFTKINLDLSMGEFVVITGESGSGKSTLLNVISGLDTYEEGEMYINGEETSYFSEIDFELYRKKYIGNIFQNFNLVNSYTVYQNIELIYLINGYKSKDVKEKVNDLLKQVDLYKYKNTKTSKLSGGQKQRVAIARALAKETPIIVADEPTGNLDTKSAVSVMKLLYEISKDKLVIIVTHNYDQVSEYVTRRIKMHDGKILEDTMITKSKEGLKAEEKEFGKLGIINKFKLGFKNTFNLIPKFLLLLLVYSFLTIAVIGVYSSIMKSSYDNSLLGTNQFFKDTTDSRIILKKNDGSSFNDDDYIKLEKMNNIESIIKSDLLLDTQYSISNENTYLWGNIYNINSFKGTVDIGRMPKEENEIIISGNRDDWYLSNPEDMLEKEYFIEDGNTGSGVLQFKLKIVGIMYYKNDQNNYDYKFYANDNVINDLMKSINKSYSEVESLLNNNLLKSSYYQYNIMPSNNVDTGSVIVSENLSMYCKNYYCKNSDLTIKVKNLYYRDSLNLNISNTYNKDNFTRITGYSDYDKYSSSLFINSNEYYSLFDKENYQSSVYIEDVKKFNDTIVELENMGYKTLYVKDTLVDYTAQLMLFVNIIQFFGIAIALVALFFISYFIIKIILNSRNTYFSIMRMLGTTKRDLKTMLNIELNIVLNISYILIITFIFLILNNVLNIDYIYNIIGYLKITDYIVLYIILFIISILISNKYSKKLFENSVMKTYRGEV